MYLMYPGAVVVPNGTYGQGAGPVFLSELDCLGSETSLLNCNTRQNQPPGLHSCQHSRDVAVKCIGE